MNTKEIKTILTTAGLHHSQYQYLHVQPSANGFSCSFKNVVSSADIKELESNLKRHSKLGDFIIEVYRKEKNVIARIVKNATRSMTQSSPRSFYRNEIRKIMGVDPTNYYMIDAYSSKSDWVVVYYKCGLDTQLFADKLNASKYFGKYSIKSENGNIYITLKNTLVEVTEKVVEKTSNQFNTLAFIKESMNHISQLNEAEFIQFTELCQMALKTNDILVIMQIAKLVGKQLQVNLV